MVWKIKKKTFTAFLSNAFLLFSSVQTKKKFLTKSNCPTYFVTKMARLTLSNKANYIKIMHANKSNINKDVAILYIYIYIYIYILYV